MKSGITFSKDIEQILNWKPINKVLSKVEIRRTPVAGRDAFSAEVMFRIMLLQIWYQLSDYQMEEQLGYNIMFMWFYKLSLENPVPDHSTISRWRARFSKKGIYEKLLKEMNKQITGHSIRINEGTILDATIVGSKARPRKNHFGSIFADSMNTMFNGLESCINHVSLYSPHPAFHQRSSHDPRLAAR